ncbi:hypothetical protein [Novipirellula aureliae]|uniref:hypothetical protein n=1 Tax=Novipirellula aureliae TaxID=2527966 RepID=UPI0011B3B0B3|nr:hypothetical protein [Novipirellula aureliae]
MLAATTRLRTTPLVPRFVSSSAGQPPVAASSIIGGHPIRLLSANRVYEAARKNSHFAYARPLFACVQVRLSARSVRGLGIVPKAMAGILPTNEKRQPFGYRSGVASLQCKRWNTHQRDLTHLISSFDFFQA